MHAAVYEQSPPWQHHTWHWHTSWRRVSEEKNARVGHFVQPGQVTRQALGVQHQRAQKQRIKGTGVCNTLLHTRARTHFFCRCCRKFWMSSKLRRAKNAYSPRRPSCSHALGCTHSPKIVTIGAALAAVKLQRRHTPEGGGGCALQTRPTSSSAWSSSFPLEGRFARPPASC